MFMTAGHLPPLGIGTQDLKQGTKMGGPRLITPWSLHMAQFCLHSPGLRCHRHRKTFLTNSCEDHRGSGPWQAREATEVWVGLLWLLLPQCGRWWSGGWGDRKCLQSLRTSSYFNFYNILLVLISILKLTQYEHMWNRCYHRALIILYAKFMCISLLTMTFNQEKNTHLKGY